MIYTYWANRIPGDGTTELVVASGSISIGHAGDISPTELASLSPIYDLRSGDQSSSWRPPPGGVPWLVSSSSIVSPVSNLLPLSQSSPVQATTYVLQHSDVATTVEFDDASPITATIPANVFNPGEWLNLRQVNTGKVTLSTAAGVTLNSNGGLFGSGGQWACMSLECRAANNFILSGDLA
jgi:hypothetical protein